MNGLFFIATLSNIHRCCTCEAKVDPDVEARVGRFKRLALCCVRKYLQSKLQTLLVSVFCATRSKKKDTWKMTSRCGKIGLLFHTENCLSKLFCLSCERDVQRPRTWQWEGEMFCSATHMIWTPRILGYFFFSLRKPVTKDLKKTGSEGMCCDTRSFTFISCTYYFKFVCALFIYFLCWRHPVCHSLIV